MELSNNADFLKDATGNIPGFKNAAGESVPFVTATTNAVTGGIDLTAGDSTIKATQSYTLAQLLYAVSLGYVGNAFVTDVGNGSIWVSDGTRARPLNGSVVVYSNPTPINLGTTAVRAVGIAIPLPIGLLSNGDSLEISVDISKSGAVDGSTTQLQIGASVGTVGSQIGNSSMAMIAANRRIMGTFRVLRSSATSVILLNGPNGQDGIATSSDLAITTTTVADMGSAMRYLQLTNAMTVGGSDVLSVNKMIVKVIAAQ